MVWVDDKNGNKNISFVFSAFKFSICCRVGLLLEKVVGQLDVYKKEGWHLYCGWFQDIMALICADTAAIRPSTEFSTLSKSPSLMSVTAETGLIIRIMRFQWKEGGGTGKNGGEIRLLSSVGVVDEANGWPHVF